MPFSFSLCHNLNQFNQNGRDCKQYGSQYLIADSFHSDNCINYILPITSAIVVQNPLLLLRLVIQSSRFLHSMLEFPVNSHLSSEYLRKHFSACLFDSLTSFS
jgi:hypothetical protein